MKEQRSPCGRTGEPRLHFAYGSNLDVDQMTLRCTEPRVLGRATLPGYRLAFAGMNILWEEMGVATVLPAPGGRVDGVLYALTEADLRRLDEWEGCPIAYDRQLVEVRDEEGRVRQAFIYVRLSGVLRANPPGARYLRMLRREYQRLGFDLTPLVLAAREAA